jgi:uncharacterized protein YbjT (DUF2867 family)
MTILVIGATGTLGRQVVRRALDEGHSVRCLVRSPKKAAFLREWGAETFRGDLCIRESLDAALVGMDGVIDAATARPNESILKIDWEGKVSLIQAMVAANVKRYIFFSIVDAKDHPDVPLMRVKTCTNAFLAESGLEYTTLELSGFLQGLISQYAIPIIERQTVWVTGEATPVAYMDTQDIAKFAVRALAVPETIGHTYPVVGTKAWGGMEIVRHCETLAQQDAKIARMPIDTLQLMRKFTRTFQWGWNMSDRLAFAEVLTSGNPMTADMTQVYQTFGIDPAETSTMESYLKEYFDRIIKKLKELNYDNRKETKKKLPF